MIKIQNKVIFPSVKKILPTSIEILRRNRRMEAIYLFMR